MMAVARQLDRCRQQCEHEETRLRVLVGLLTWGLREYFGDGGMWGGLRYELLCKVLCGRKCDSEAGQCPSQPQCKSRCSCGRIQSTRGSEDGDAVAARAHEEV